MPLCDRRFNRHQMQLLHAGTFRRSGNTSPGCGAGAPTDIGRGWSCGASTSGKGRGAHGPVGCAGRRGSRMAPHRRVTSWIERCVATATPWHGSTSLARHRSVEIDRRGSIPTRRHVGRAAYRHGTTSPWTPPGRGLAAAARAPALGARIASCQSRVPTGVTGERRRGPAGRVPRPGAAGRRPGPTPAPARPRRAFRPARRGRSSAGAPGHGSPAGGPSTARGPGGGSPLPPGGASPNKRRRTSSRAAFRRTGVLAPSACSPRRRWAVRSACRSSDRWPGCGAAGARAGAAGPGTRRAPAAAGDSLAGHGGAARAAGGGAARAPRST